jgi:hypothetical protein
VKRKSFAEVWYFARFTLERANSNPHRTTKRHNEKAELGVARLRD